VCPAGMPTKSNAKSTCLTSFGAPTCNGMAMNDHTDASTTTRPTQTAARCCHAGIIAACSDGTSRSSH
jgi:hypothetical protein